MRRLVALLLSCLIPLTAFAADKDNSYKVIYDGGSIQGVKAGADVHLFVEPKQIRIVRGKDEVLATIPAESVTEISYGQDVHRRIGTAIGLAVISLGIGRLWRFRSPRSTSSA